MKSFLEKYCLIVLGLVSIAFGGWELYKTSDTFINGPSIYDPNTLYLVMYSRPYFFMPQWIYEIGLITAGAFAMLNAKRSFFLYYFFFITYLLVWIPKMLDAPKTWGDHPLDLISILLSIAGIIAFSAPKAKALFGIKKGISWKGILIIFILFYGISELPFMLF